VDASKNRDIQGDSGGKVNILGRDIIGHGDKEKFV
jgi:hypothetical protein